jgi:type I restriction enzyme S subunit
MKVSEICKYAPKSNIKARDACDGGKYVFFTSSADESKRYNAYQHEGEGIIMGTGGNATLHYYDGKYAVSTDCIVLLPNEQIRCKYLYYFFLGNMRVLERGFKGAGLKHTNKGYIGDIDIGDIPSFERQEKIIGIFDTLQSIIDLRKSEIERLDNLIKARFVEMFGSPVSNPMSWEKRTLKEVCIKLNDGSHFSPESFETGDYKYVTAKNIKFSGFDFSNITYVPEAVHRPIFDRCNPEFEDVLYIKDGATTGVAIVNTLDEEFTLLSSVALLKQDRSIMNGYFLATLLNNKDMYLNIRNNMGGAAITRLTIAKLNAIEIIVPPIELQNQFAAFVAEVDKSKLMFQKLHQKLNILQQKAGDI